MLKKCKQCKKGKTKRQFCGKVCRDKHFTQKYAQYRAEWQRKRQDARASIPSDKKVQCLICGRWYVQVGSHAYLRHGITGREYREAFDLEVKKGIVPAWYRELKGEQALENGTWKNLKKGKKFWFIKGDEKAGKYVRSPITLERLQKLYKLKKKSKKNENKRTYRRVEEV